MLIGKIGLSTKAVARFATAFVKKLRMGFASMVAILLEWVVDSSGRDRDANFWKDATRSLGYRCLDRI